MASMDDNYFNQGDNPNDNDDDPNFDWLDDDDASDSVSGDPQHTGVTGELDWQKLVGDEDSPSDSADDAYEWQGDSAEDGAPVDDGDADLMPWQATNASDDDDSFGDDSFDDDDNLDDSSTINQRDDVGKLQRQRNFEETFGATIDAAENAEFGDTGELLDWMSDMDESDDADGDNIPPPISEMPDWLSGMELPDVSEKAVTDALESIDDDANAMSDSNDTDDDADDLSWLDAADDFGSGQTAIGQATDDDTDDADDDMSWLNEADDFAEDASDDFATAVADEGATAQGDDMAWLNEADDFADDFVDDFADDIADEAEEDFPIGNFAGELEDEDEVPFDAVLNKLSTGELPAITDDDDDASWLPDTGSLDDDDSSWLTDTGALASDDDGSWLPDTGSLDDDDDSWLQDTGALEGDDHDDDSWMPDTGSLEDDDDSWLQDTGSFASDDEFANENEDEADEAFASAISDQFVDDIADDDADAGEIDWSADLGDVLDEADDAEPVAGDMPDWFSTDETARC
jgi:hypothetical protein